ncbi:MAG TPA: OmpA family protein [Chitinophagaceae bacterium]
MLFRITLTLLFIYFLNHNVRCQTTDTTQDGFAPVNVVVTDMRGKPSKGEQIFFKSDKSSKLYAGRSDANGKFSLVLPVGSRYTITVKAMTDTTKYSTIDIPAPGPDEYYTEPFLVNVKFNLAKSYTLDHVHFDFGKASLRPESFHELDELVDFMKIKESVRIEIAGHTDNVGADADNLLLSQQRADAIRTYLLKKGVEAARVTAKGYGAGQPIADNATDKGRQLNRRTEVRIL